MPIQSAERVLLRKIHDSPSAVVPAPKVNVRLVRLCIAERLWFSEASLISVKVAGLSIEKSSIKAK